ncbi:hypothetical protein AMECASPLE_037723, partial [Ameca splendens]
KPTMTPPPTSTSPPPASIAPPDSQSLLHTIMCLTCFNVGVSLLLLVLLVLQFVQKNHEEASPATVSSAVRTADVLQGQIICRANRSRDTAETQKLRDVNQDLI